MKDLILDGLSMRGLWSPFLARLEVETLHCDLVFQHATKRIKFLFHSIHRNMASPIA